MTLDEILFELSGQDEENRAVVVLVVTQAGGTPTEVRAMATDATGLDLLAAAGTLLDTVSNRAMADDSAESGDVAANVEIAGIHLGLAVDALLRAPRRRGALS